MTLDQQEREAREVARNLFPVMNRARTPFMAALLRGEHLNDEFLRGAEGWGGLGLKRIDPG